MRILLIGNGKMATAIKKVAPGEIVATPDCKEKIISFSERVDAVMDFSHPALLEATLSYVKKARVPVLIGTTGYDSGQIAAIRGLSDYVPVCLSSTFASGILYLKKILPVFKDWKGTVTIHEIHHKGKKDAPSGTALLLKKEWMKHGFSVEITSDREGDIKGIHEIILEDGDQKIILRHEVKNRELFANGAMLALRNLIRKEKGWYTCDELM